LEETRAEKLSTRAPSQGFRPAEGWHDRHPLADDLQISGQTIFVWRRQEAIDNGELPGVRSTEEFHRAGRAEHGPPAHR
jgi:hypothetical protein